MSPTEFSHRVHRGCAIKNTHGGSGISPCDRRGGAAQFQLRRGQRKTRLREACPRWLCTLYLLTVAVGKCTDKEDGSRGGRSDAYSAASRARWHRSPRLRPRPQSLARTGNGREGGDSGAREQECTRKAFFRWGGGGQRSEITKSRNRRFDVIISPALLAKKRYLWATARARDTRAMAGW